MKELFKRLSVICLVVLLLTACGTKLEEDNTPVNPINREVDNSKVNQVLNYSNIDEGKDLTSNTIVNEFTLPDFEVTLKTDTKTYEVTKNSIKDLLKYSKTLKTTIGNYEVTFRYNGVMLEDVLDLYKIDKYNSVVFRTSNGSAITLSKRVAPKAMLVFQSNGNNLGEFGPIKVVVPTYGPEYWLENIIQITVS